MEKLLKLSCDWKKLFIKRWNRTVGKNCIGIFRFSWGKAIRNVSIAMDKALIEEEYYILEKWLNIEIKELQELINTISRNDVKI